MLLLFSLLACETSYYEPYQLFVLPEGKHSKVSKVQTLQSDVLSFKAIFDETAIYTSTSDENQHDTNKLLGFSDCNSHHHDHSARFGWRWLDGQLEILAYAYVSGERIIEPIGPISLNEPSNFTLTLHDNAYVFTVNDHPEVRIARDRPCYRGIYYMLWPYFGGNEVAPHDITIKLLIAYQ